MSQPDLPKDPAEYRQKPLMGVGFWAMIALCLLCVLAGAAVAWFAPRLLRGPEPPAPPPTPAAPAASAAPIPLPVVVEPAPGEVARLNARIAALEDEGARTSEAAAAALALAELVDAARTSRPFAEELAALRAASPNLPELAALSRLAEVGAPTRAALALSFPDYAARAASRARKPAQDAGLSQRIAYAAGKVVTVRRVDDLAGSSPDALIARAELALSEGEVTVALTLLGALPPKARDSIAAWRAGAERRAEVDRAVASLRARAVRELSAEAGR